ncbi:MAG: cytochrome ubiquinol oxidase subunit I [Rhizobiales bacterium]|nr:cytochrome ubiquinol oxidase subunit I [Hyphomicrobiales bacterium]
MPPIDVEILARLQFAFTVSFHILFPTLTIGLAAFLVILEARYLRSKDDAYLRLYRFWVKVFALTFGMGVVSGLVLSYQFGTNWSEYSRISGPVLGPLIGFEVLTAFFLEAGFLGVMLFGWDKVGPRLHFLATCLVGFGTSLSAFWILSANSWMQTPAGAHFDAALGTFVADDWLAIIFNPSFPYRFMHMMTASFLTSSLVIAGISAFFLLRHDDKALARKGFSMAMWAIVILAPLQIFLGDLHGLNTLEHQPTKVAAMEGNWETQSRAPLLLFAIPDQKAETNHLELGIPGGASLILRHSLDGVVPGLKDVAAEDRPPVGIVFWSFRVMVGLGFIFLAVGAYGLYARWRGTLYTDKWLARACLTLTPAGFIATLAGWFVTEVGRQPYTIYGLLRSSDSISPIVSASAVATTLTLFIIVYGGLFGAYLYYLIKLVRAGTAPISGQAPEAMQGARPGLVVPAE